MPASKNRSLQMALLIVWVSILVLEVSVPAQSQGCVPPLVTPGYMNPSQLRTDPGGPLSVM